MRTLICPKGVHNRGVPLYTLQRNLVAIELTKYAHFEHTLVWVYKFKGHTYIVKPHFEHTHSNSLGLKFKGHTYIHT